MRTALCLALVVPCLVACADAAPEERVGHALSALTADQCEFFDVNGKVVVCHATSSTKNPYVIIRTDEAGCVNGHEDHVGDYVAPPNDPTCSGKGCYPEGAPYDGTIECCEGLVVDAEKRCARPSSEECVMYDRCSEEATIKAEGTYKECIASGRATTEACATKAAEVFSAIFQASGCEKLCQVCCAADEACQKECTAVTWSPTVR